MLFFFLQFLDESTDRKSITELKTSLHQRSESEISFSYRNKDLERVLRPAMLAENDEYGYETEI